MGNIIQFEKGCRHCDGLTRIDKCTYICNKRAHMDDSSIILIKDGAKTRDWNICRGEYYNYNAHISFKQQSR